MDENSKLGVKYVKNDPHTISTNGTILASIIERHIDEERNHVLVR